MFIFQSMFLSYAARIFSEKQAHYIRLADLLGSTDTAAHGPRCGGGGGDEGKRFFSLAGNRTLVVQALGCQHINLIESSEVKSSLLFMDLQPFVGPWPLFSSLILYAVRMAPWTRDQLVARPLPLYTGQHKHRINAHNTNIHASSGIRTPDSIVRASQDSSCLKTARPPRSAQVECDSLKFCTVKPISFTHNSPVYLSHCTRHVKSGKAQGSVCLLASWWFRPAWSSVPTSLANRFTD
jgi:hypothetical protein